MPLTGAGAAHDAHHLLAADGQADALEDDGGVVAVSHLIVLEAHLPALRPPGRAAHASHGLHVQRSLRDAQLVFEERKGSWSLPSPSA